jgi:hypothetical protein
MTVDNSNNTLADGTTIDSFSYDSVRLHFTSSP